VNPYFRRNVRAQSRLREETRRSRRQLRGELGSGTNSRGNTQYFSSLLELVGLVVAPVSVLAGALLYFGWVRTSAVFTHFGIDQALLKLSAQDYVLRSTAVIFRPMMFLLVSFTLGVACLDAINSTRRLPGRAKTRRQIGLLVSLVGLTLVAIGLVGAVRSFLPLTSAIAFGLGSFILYCSIRIFTDNFVGRTESGLQLRSISFVLTAAAIVISLFWATSIYAQRSGSALATYIEANTGSSPEAIIYSRVPLHLAGPEIKETMLAGTADSPNYRYKGYRLLIYSNERWFLIPSAWSSSGDNPAVVLADDGSIRVEFLPQTR